jgi:hypothetical protein
MSGHIPEQLALFLRNFCGLSCAIETGTWKGESTAWLALNFDRVWSIELDVGWYNRAVQTLGGELSNLTLIHGNSAEKLKGALDECGERALLWLDAHWCGGAQKGHKQDEECPLRDELAAIHNSAESHVVLIDDARLFTGVPEYPHNPNHWPTLDEIVMLLPEMYRVMIYRDVIVCVHDNVLPALREWVQRNG